MNTTRVMRHPRRGAAVLGPTLLLIVMTGCTSVAVSSSSPERARLSVRPFRFGPGGSPVERVNLVDVPRWHVTMARLFRRTSTLPGRGLPEFTVRALRPAAVRRLEQKMRDAGLDVADEAEDPEEPATGWEFAAVDGDGELAVHRVLTPTPAQQRVLAALQDPAAELGSGPGEVGAEAAYLPAALRVRAEPLERSGAAAPGGPARWPLADYPLAALGSCQYLEGAEAAPLLRQARARAVASTLTRTADGVASGSWVDRGRRYRVSLRLVLPGEGTCPRRPPSR